MFSGATHRLPRIEDWQHAHNYFERTKCPPRARRWDDNERPLRNARMYHYRIAKNERDGLTYYDIILYNTVMARYWQPDADGYEMREYVAHSSLTSRKFMADVLGLWQQRLFATTCGRKVYMPVSWTGVGFSTRALFLDGKLDVERSTHLPLFKTVQSPEDTAAAKRVRAALEPLLTLCAMRIPELEQTESAYNWSGRPFNNSVSGGPMVRCVFSLSSAVLRGEELPAEHVRFFIDEVASECYTSVLSRMAAKERLLSFKVTDIAAADLARDYGIRVAPKQLIASMWGLVKRCGAIPAGNGREAYPMFPEPGQIPWSNVTTRKP